MTAKLNPYAAAPKAMKNWTGLSIDLPATLDPEIVDLVKIRASQINACANCINMHVVEARARGEREQRLHLLPAWREAPCYTARERAALAWTEALTRLSERHPSEADQAAFAAAFSEEEQVTVTLLVNVINGWNRIAVGFGLWVEQPVVDTQKAAA